MEDFLLWLLYGYNHIADVKAYDHILYILTISSIFNYRQWKKTAVLVTCFTLGHSLSLGLSALNIINFNSYWIELLIPVTIVLTSVSNVILSLINQQQPAFKLNIAFVTFFGLIHGLGFSNFFKALLGQEESILKSLLAFNLGVETGQVLILFMGLLLQFTTTSLLKISNKLYVLVLNLCIAAIASYLLIELIQNG